MIAGARPCWEITQVGSHPSGDALLAELFKANRSAACAVRRDGTIIAWNDGAEALYGWSAAEVIGRSIFEVVDAYTLSSPAFGKVFTLLDQGRTVEQAGVRKRKDGSAMSVRVSITPLRDCEGAVWGALAYLTDVTFEQRADEARREDSRRAAEENARLAALVASTNDAIIAFDREARIVSVNPAAERLFNVEAASLIGTTVFANLPGREDQARQTVGKVLAGEAPREFDFVFHRPDGAVLELSIALFPIRDARGEVIGGATISRDRTEKVRAERQLKLSAEQLEAARRLEAVGTLAGGVAHDFNNLLTVMLNGVTLAQRELGVHPANELLRQCQDAAERGVLITRQLLAFGRRQMVQETVLDLAALLAEAEPMLRRLSGPAIQVSLLLETQGMKLRADRGQLEQVLLNLVVNARDAMPDGGKLVLELKRTQVGEALARAHPGLAPGGYLQLSVSDSGVGMDAATRARVFEPFFTTKREQGTGLGLSTVFGIVKQSGGAVWVESKPGHGARFELLFPACEQTADASAAVDGARPPRGRETVLVVEDEAPVRAIVARVLGSHGYRVLEASGPGDALLISEEHSAPVDLLLTDVVMPRLSGRQLAERLLAQRPRLKVLFMSGYVADAELRQGLPAGAGFLEKPMTDEALLRAVRQVLSAPSG